LSKCRIFSRFSSKNLKNTKYFFSAEWSRVSGVAECESEALANVDEDMAAVPEDVERCAILWACISMGTEELKVRRAARASGEFIAQGSISFFFIYYISI